jgi:hypothetical protein
VHHVAVGDAVAAAGVIARHATSVVSLVTRPLEGARKTHKDTDNFRHGILTG